MRVFYKIHYVFVAIILIFTSCSTHKNIGVVKYGDNGKVISGSSVTGCMQPSKRYTKNLEAKVNASFDSVKMTPKSVLEASVQQTVTYLTDYSSEGLDLDLIMFRVCEMANNRGLTSVEINSLFQIATDAWSKKGQNTNGSNSGTNSGIVGGQKNFLQSHIVNGVNNGVNGNVNLNQPLKLSSEYLEWIYNYTDSLRNASSTPKILMVATAPYSNAPLFAGQIVQYFKAKGYTIEGNGQLLSAPETPDLQRFAIGPYPNKSSMQIDIGYFPPEDMNGK